VAGGRRCAKHGGGKSPAAASTGCAPAGEYFPSTILRAGATVGLYKLNTFGP
jgi:hypothetical protein